MNDNFEISVIFLGRKVLGPDTFTGTMHAKTVLGNVKDSLFVLNDLGSRSHFIKKNYMY